MWLSPLFVTHRRGGSEALRGHRPVLMISHLPWPQWTFTSAYPSLGPRRVSAVCPPAELQPPASPLWPPQAEGGRRLLVSSCSKPCGSPDSAHTPVSNLFPFRDPCASCQDPARYTLWSGSLKTRWSWAPPRQTAAPGPGLWPPRWAPPADLQWCRRTIQLNSRLQS